MTTQKDVRDLWSYFPIQNQQIEDLYQAQVAAFWTKADLLFTDSSSDMGLLNEKTKKLLYGVLAIFAQFDGLISEKVDNLTEHPEIKKIKESQRFFHIQNAIETIHNEVYGLMLIHYVQNEEERLELMSAATEIPIIKKLADWIENESNNTNNILKKLFINAAVEGVMFQALFAIIFWFRKTYKGKFLGLTIGNELISRDENLHASHAILLLNVLKTSFMEKNIHQDDVDWISNRNEIVSCIENMMVILEEFYAYFLPEQILDLKKDDLMDYTKNWANILIQSIGHNPRYDVKNSLEFMEVTGMQRKHNFFESRETAYSKNITHKNFVINYDLLE